MKILKITIISLFITLSSCSKMDTNTGSGKVRMIKEFNNWIVDKTTSEQTLDEKIEFQLDSITSEVKKLSLYPDELKMEVLNKTEKKLMLGEASLSEGKGIIFNMTPSPGATSCLGNAERDIKVVCDYLKLEFNEAQFLADLTDPEIA